MSLAQDIVGLASSNYLTPAIWGFAACLVFCVLLVLTKVWHGSLTMDFIDGVQKFHTMPTPRVGGVPIVIALIFALGKAPVEVKNILTPILIAGMPAFLFGVAEDLTKRVGVLQRLLATMASGVLAWWLTDYSLSRLDIWGVDWFMKLTLVSVLFSAFAVGGVANAINIIDGFNGLASTMAVLAFLGYSLIAWKVGDHNLAGVSFILAACVWGFFWVNWPLGKVFLGDGGAYFIGFALAWVAILLIERNVSVSAFAALLVCTHPVTEVLFSIFRRKLKKQNPGHPDRLHFHSLVKQRYVSRWFYGLTTVLQNSITGFVVGMLTLVSILLAYFFIDNPTLSFLAFLALTLGYVAIYARMVRFRWTSPFSFLISRPPKRIIQDH